MQYSTHILWCVSPDLGTIANNSNSLRNTYNELSTKKHTYNEPPMHPGVNLVKLQISVFTDLSWLEMHHEKEQRHQFTGT